MKKIISVFTIFLLFSCRGNELKILSINSNIPAIIPVLEEFNKSNNNIKLILNDQRSTLSDIYIFQGQLDSLQIETVDLNNLLEEKIGKDIFYMEIINNMYDSNGDIHFLPLAFEIPGFIYNKDRKNHENYIDLDELLTSNEIIFSPFWEDNFVLYYYITSLPLFNMNKNYLDRTEFIKASTIMKNLIENRNDKWDEKTFSKKYMHLSPATLISNGTIDYYFYYMSDYLKNSNSDKVSFSSLSKNGMIFTTDTMTYIGIGSRSKNVKAAEDVLLWIFNPVNQKKIINNSTTISSTNNLYLGKLSTLKEVTETVLPESYNELNLLIPQSELITVPKGLPPSWESLKTEVFIPVFKEIKNIQQNQWERKYLEYFNDWSKKHNK